MEIASFLFYGKRFTVKSKANIINMEVDMYEEDREVEFEASVVESMEVDKEDYGAKKTGARWVGKMEVDDEWKTDMLLLTYYLRKMSVKDYNSKNDNNLNINYGPGDGHGWGRL